MNHRVFITAKAKSNDFVICPREKENGYLFEGYIFIESF